MHLRLLLLSLPFAWLLPSMGWSQAAARRGPNIDTIVVCAPDLLPAATQWIEYRTRQGHLIALLSGSDSADEIKRAITNVSQRADLKFVVLMGDVPSTGVKNGAQVESQQVPSRVIRRWGAGASFTSDHFYADLDDDGAPDLAVGRITADSSSELTSILAKSIAYEQNKDFGVWRRRVNFVAGVGGFGAVADTVLETATKSLITNGIPPEFCTTMTQANWRSPYSPDPRRFQQQTIARLNQGCLAWVYVGHGQRRTLDYYRVPGGNLPILSDHDVVKVASQRGAPIAVFLSCHAGAFDGDRDCLAEELLSKPGGPVAVIAGTSVTMPYAMSVMGNAMMRELFAMRRSTVGEVLLHAKRELTKTTAERPQSLIDQLANWLSPDPELLEEERAEHVRLFHLLGDPLLRIRRPKTVLVSAPSYGTAGDTIQVTGEAEVNGPCVIELVCRRDRLTFKPARRASFEATNQWLDQMQETYQRANNQVWTSVQHAIEDGTFSAQLAVPKHAMGPSHVRVFVHGEQDYAMGSADIYLRLPPDAQPGEARASRSNTSVRGTVFRPGI